MPASRALASVCIFRNAAGTAIEVFEKTESLKERKIRMFKKVVIAAVASIFSAVSANAGLTFEFTYGVGAGIWTAERRTALDQSAAMIGAYFSNYTATLTFAVTGENANTSTLASAGSDLVNSGSGFFDTIVQQKIITNGLTDANGGTADGTINWNFYHTWDLTDTVAGGAYDFKSTAMHEILHAAGFLSYVGAAGSNTGTTWTKMDSLMTNSAGVAAINPTTFAWDTGFNSLITQTAPGVPNTTGLFLKGTEAFAANGSAVIPLYCPTPFESGSSVSHLDDNTYTGVNSKLMNAATNAGPGVRTLSAIELGILKDIGYSNVSPVPEPGSAVLIFSVMMPAMAFLRRRKS